MICLTVPPESLTVRCLNYLSGTIYGTVCRIVPLEEVACGVRATVSHNMLLSGPVKKRCVH